MSRGWESKDVESQQHAHQERMRRSAGPKLSAEQQARQARRDMLLLDRTRVQHDLDAAHNPRYREVMRKALAHINAQLAELEEASSGG